MVRSAMSPQARSKPRKLRHLHSVLLTEWLSQDTWLILPFPMTGSGTELQKMDNRTRVSCLAFMVLWNLDWIPSRHLKFCSVGKNWHRNQVGFTLTATVPHSGSDTRLVFNVCSLKERISKRCRPVTWPRFSRYLPCVANAALSTWKVFPCHFHFLFLFFSF